MMGGAVKQLHLNVFIMGNGHHEAAWRHLDSRPEAVSGADHYIRIARTAERGLLDSLFLADAYGLPPMIRYKSLMSLEPFTLLSALSRATSRIGLIGTASTTFSEPYHVARAFASLDHISGGRAGWNIVTSTSDAIAYNFSDARLPEHEQRYARADEFLRVVTGLWDGWGDGAFVADKSSGVYANTDNIGTLNHRGDWFAVRGPLNIAPAPQRHPVLVQAGASESGRQFAAKSAEIVYTAQNTAEEGQRFYADVKSRLAQHGRAGESMKILPGFCAVIGDTAAEARDKERELLELTQTVFGVTRLSNVFKTDMSVYPIDGPIPFDQLPKQEDINGHRGRHQLFIDMARRDNLTIRQLIERTAASRGHFCMAGTPVAVADEMQRWLNEGAADGFNLMPPLLPGSLDDFVDTVVPELQNRGLFRTEYADCTLRGHYGLGRPE